MSTIDEIKSKIDIVDLVSEAGVKLRHAGRNYTGFCPFHDNKHTPAFVIWPETGTWRCFGQCNEGGDIFKFVMKREGIDFKEALQKLAARAGVQLQEYQRETPAPTPRRKRRRRVASGSLCLRCAARQSVGTTSNPPPGNNIMPASFARLSISANASKPGISPLIST